MNIKIRNLALLGLVAICLFAIPAFSMPDGNSAFNAPCNASEKNCNVWAGGMGHPEMGMMAGPYMAMHKMSSSKNASWNKTEAFEIRQGGKGFAISDTQNKILKMSIEGQISPNSADIKSLISENKTLAQIKSDIKAKMNAEIASASYNGSLRLGDRDYNLAQIKVTHSMDNKTTIEADLIGPKANAKDEPTTTAGHITVTTTRQDNSTIGEGTLTMNSGGKYKVLLDMGHAGGEFNRMGAIGFGGMNKNEERFGNHAMMNVPMPRIDQKA